MAKNILLKSESAAPNDKSSKKGRKTKAKKANSGSKFAMPTWEKATETWADERVRSVAGLLAMGMALIFALAIFSSFSTGSLDIRIITNNGERGEFEAYHNLLGSLGAHIGFWLARGGLGLGALGVPFLMALFGLRWLTDKTFLPLAKTLRLTAFLAMFVPWALAFFTYSSSLASTGALDHLTGNVGRWLLTNSIHYLKPSGSAIVLLIIATSMLAYNTPVLYRKIGQKLGSWFKSSEESMLEEDAQDDAAVREASNKAEKPAQNSLLHPDSNVTSGSIAANSPAETPTDRPQASNEEHNVDTSTPLDVVTNDPEPTLEPTSPLTSDADEISVQKEPDPATPLEPTLETTSTPEQNPTTSAGSPSESTIEEKGGVEFEVKESQEEESLSSDELKDLAEEFGEEYDPTLDLGRFQLPNLDQLVNHGDGKNRVTDEELQQNKENILRTLSNFNIEVSKITAEVGPTVTLYEIVPAPGIRISKIKNLEDDIALSLAALGIRIIAPIPGKGTIGIEVPNSNPDVVSMRTLIASDKFQNSDAALPIALGKTISNETYVFDMAKMPHLLMAGATGQGKSVGLNAMLVSMLYRRHPSQLKFVLVDPKKVELTLYNKIVRHYLAQLPDSEDAIITDTSKVVSTLNSLCVEMDQRYELLKAAQCRNLKEYNVKFVKRKIIPGLADGHPDNGKDLHRLGHHYMPYIVLVVDEFADLIMTAGKEVETPIARLAQLARAIGIHLIIATQRPSVNIITGTIKANFPARVAFRVTSKIDSRTILDAGGADQLIGRGDMLMSTGNDLIRLQCGFVDTPEVDDICDFIGSQQGYPTPYELPPPPAEANDSSGPIGDDERDPMFEDAARVLVMHQQGSTSLLQRKLKLGYNRAGRLIDQLESAGIIGPFEGSKARKVLVPDEASLEQLLQSSSTPTE